MDIKKEIFKTKETVSSGTSAIMTDGDFIVPDNKADIGQIIRVSAVPAIHSYEIQGEKAVVSGEVTFTVLYLPENMAEDFICSLNYSRNFTDVCDTKGATGNVFVHFDCDIASLDFAIINSRKINLKATVDAAYSAYRINENALPTEISCDFPLEIQKTGARALTVVTDEKIILKLPERFALPDEMSAADEILSVDAEVIGHDVKIITGKAIIKGSIKLSILYKSFETSAAEFFEHEYSFTEILDLPEITDDMDVEIQYKIQSVSCDMDTASSGFEVETEVAVHVMVTAEKTPIVITDCYSPDFKLNVTTRSCPLEYLAWKSSDTVSVRSFVSLPDNCPPVMKIYRTVAKPFIDSITGDSATTVINGTLDTYILYMSSEPDMPLYSYRSPISFTVSADTGVISDTAKIECDVMCDECTFLPAGINQVEIRANVTVKTKVTDTESIDVIENISVGDAINPSPGTITICFIEQGETMWDIAKRYCVPAEKIYFANKLPVDVLPKAGTPLLIP